MEHSRRGGGSRSTGRLLRERRLARGLTQQEAAERAGVSVGAWRSTESGQRRPRPHTFAAILDSLDLSLEDVRSPVIHLDGERVRDELVQLCRDELPGAQVDLVLRVVELAIQAEAAVDLGVHAEAD